MRGMALLDILSIPDPILRQKSLPVTSFNKELRAFADEMLASMYAAPGIGLAAVQVGVLKRMLVIDLAKRDESPPNPQIYLNPEITWSSEERSIYEEGCLSIPEFYEDVTRPANVRVRYLDIDGKQKEVEATGLLATCLQHEIDHLNGVLFIDYISKLKRDRVLKKFTKIARREG
jgi:peptide deformylase